MVNQADVVVGFVKYSFGGAYKYYSLAKRKGKTLINLAEKN